MGKLSDEIIEQIPILYGKYKNKTKVARELNISVSSVNKYLTLGETICLSNNEKDIPTDEEELKEQINIRYRECKNLAQVAREFKMTSAKVKKMLDKDSEKVKEQQNEDRDALYFYIYRLFGEYKKEQPVNPWNIVQMQKFQKTGYPYKGQLLTLKYFYEVKKHKVNEDKKTIGIIPYIFKEARSYYEEQAKRADEINEAITKQLEKDRLEININPADQLGGNKRKKKINLDTI